MKKHNKAFTLVELIVVITILAILWTIAFIAMESYSKSSRDSVRISDMSKIKSVLEYFYIGAWKYPVTTDWTDITYSWWMIWQQWDFWETTFNNISRLDKIPVDPLTEKKYIYSVINTKQEYEIAWFFERDNISMNNEIIFQANAWDKIATVRVTWNYNWKIVKAYISWDVYVLAVPTIISWWPFTLEEIMTNQSFVYTWYNNLPFSYSWSQYNNLWEVWWLALVNTGSYLVFSWSLEDLKWTDSQYRLEMLEWLKTAYSWTLITDNSAINDILEISDFSESNQKAVDLAWVFVNNTLWGSVSTSSSSSSSTSTSTSSSSSSSWGWWWDCIFWTSQFGSCTFWS